MVETKQGRLVMEFFPCQERGQPTLKASASDSHRGAPAQRGIACEPAQVGFRHELALRERVQAAQPEEGHQVRAAGRLLLLPCRGSAPADLRHIRYVSRVADPHALTQKCSLYRVVGCKVSEHQKA